MIDQRCPRCGWPIRELPVPAASTHPMSSGQVSYRRCVCGSWLLVLNGEVLGATRTPA
ncbi:MULTISPECIES: hypothetical protein [Prauserella]|uniref:hypothetical protein n=1 Tax=Prauserella TaxID=142577 RepID=UPI001477163D|nr:MULTISPECIES: hypothetical protein [Prauserella]